MVICLFVLNQFKRATDFHVSKNRPLDSRIPCIIIRHFFCCCGSGHDLDVTVLQYQGDIRPLTKNYT